MKLWLIPFISFFSLSARSAPLTLDDVLKSVRERFPLVQGAQQDVQAAAGEVRASEGAFDIQWKTRATSSLLGYYENDRIDSIIEKPTQIWGTSLFAGYRLGVGDFAVYDGKLETNPGGELRAGLNVPLWRDGPLDRRRANIQRAGFSVVIADAQLSQQRIEAVRLATARYWDWVGAGQKME